MTAFDWVPILFLAGIVMILVPFIGTYLVWIFQEKHVSDRSSITLIENGIYRICSIDPHHEMSWQDYLKSLLCLNSWAALLLFCILVFQDLLPFNPQHYPGLQWLQALNVSVSFITNTDWQSYAGETTLSYFSQMAGLATLNFVSAATGLSVMFALIRGISQSSLNTIGNFWVDITRGILYLLLPLSFLFALFLVLEGSPQTINPYVEVKTIESESQVIPLGPVASQVAIKQLGSNGGGFFNSNSAHPFENPTPFSNFLQFLAIILIPAASTYTFGSMVGNKKQGWVLFGVMSFLLFIGYIVMCLTLHIPNPLLGDLKPLEGVETRIGVANSLAWANTTTATSNGSTNAALSSMPPLAGGMALLNIMLGEIIFGGVGLGLCSMLFFAMFTVFLAGLMVGRTPEYLGKKIGRREIRLVMAGILIPSTIMLVGQSFSCINPTALESLSHSGPHGLTELLYAFSSCAGNNGSSFAGLNANTDYFNIALAIVMLTGRLAIIIPVLALAGIFSAQKISASTAGTFKTDNLLFAILLCVVILILGILPFFPALALGPIVEHIFLLHGQTFG